MEANKYLNLCQVNQEFLSKLTDKFPDLYFDWKITVLFYCSVHIIRGLAESNGDSLGNRHNDVFDYLQKVNSGDKIYKAFRTLYRNSRDVRYSGFTTRENFEFFCRIKFEESKRMYGQLKSWIETKGVKVEVA
ncbi:MAG TPA: hypothetical protein VGA21_14725 [Cyclobacteriaceae bacterium]|jgi:hypothetical protein